MAILEIDIEVWLRRVAPRESKESEPIFAVYLTRDISASTSDVSATDEYASRVANGLSRKTLHDDENVAAIRAREQSVYVNKSPIRFTARLRLRRDSTRLDRDSSVCMQAYCETACEQEWGLHTCGWTCVEITDLLNHSGHVIRRPICDQGLSEIGARGVASFSIDKYRNQWNSITWKMATTTVTSEEEEENTVEMRGRMPQVLRQYNMDMISQLNSLPLTSESIQIRAFPLYRSCGGCTVRPTIAFMLNPEPPSTTEDYYIRALDYVLRRRLRGLSKERLAHEISVFVDGGGSPNEAGAILMDVAMLLPTACTYLFDEVMSREGDRLVVGEDFLQGMCAVLTGDCEDFAHRAAMILWNILVGKWTSPGIAVLQSIRMQYVVTLVLKAVQSYAYCATRRDSEKEGLGAHACCDLIPLLKFREMLAASSESTDAIDLVINRRRARLFASPGTAPTAVIVGEGTNRIVEFSRGAGVDPAANSSNIRQKGISLLEAAGTSAVGCSIAEDYFREAATTTASSSFYKYTVYGIIHDTLIAAREQGHADSWPLACVAFLTAPGNADSRGHPTLGASHSDYVGCNTSRVRILVLPSPSPAAMAGMLRLEKFEHPQVPLHEGVSARFAKDRMRIVAESMRIAKDRLSCGGGGGGGNVVLTETIAPLWSLSNSVIASIVEHLYDPANHVRDVDIAFEVISESTIIVVFLIKFEQ